MHKTVKLSFAMEVTDGHSTAVCLEVQNWFCPYIRGCVCPILDFSSEQGQCLIGCLVQCLAHSRSSVNVWGNVFNIHSTRNGRNLETLTSWRIGCERELAKLRKLLGSNFFHTGEDMCFINLWVGTCSLFFLSSFLIGSKWKVHIQGKVVLS